MGRGQDHLQGSPRERIGIILTPYRPPRFMYLRRNGNHERLELRPNLAALSLSMERRRSEFVWNQ